MPWNVFGKMKPEDLAASYAYLQTIKPILNRIVRYEAGKRVTK